MTVAVDRRPLSIEGPVFVYPDVVQQLLFL